MPDSLIAIYEKGDERREAYSATDAVNLRANGYTKVVDVDPDTGVETPVEPTGAPAVEDDDATGDPTGDGGNALVPPPMGGAGSGTDEWRAYASELGVDTEGLEERGDIVDAIAEAGYPVKHDTAD